MTPEQEPHYRERIVAYMHKAMREAKVYTSWINPSERHEAAMTKFVDAVLAPDNRAFREDFLELHRLVAQYGIYNSLAQLAIKIGAPGVPDFYQGTEFWDFSLVDPDNRRPVDYARRRTLLIRIDEACSRDGRLAVATQLLDARDDRLKLFATSSLLRLRRADREVFERGSYEPLTAEGSAREHVFAFARALADRHLLIIAPRLVATLTPDVEVLPLGERIWGDTALPLPERLSAPEAYFHVLTHESVPVHRNGRAAVRAADAFAHFPIAILASAGGRPGAQ